MIDNAIEIEGLRKTFRGGMGWKEMFRRAPRRPVLNGVDLTVARGEVFGLLGPNGAGKSTLIKILCGLVLPDGGSVKVDGMDVATHLREVRRRIGLVHGDERSFFWRLTLRENLRFYARLYGLPPKQSESRIEHLVEMVGLGAAIDREMHSFSSGMRQRGAFARGLIHDPAVIILDEPTRSLDPIGAEEVREIVAERVAAGGRTVLIATHLMVEVESLCDRLAMIDSGSTVFAGTVEQLRSLKGEGVRYRISVNGAAIGLLPDLRRVSGVLEVTSNLGPSNDLSLELRLAKGTHALATVIRILVERGAEINNCSSLEPTLEEAFRALISQGRELAVPAVAS